ncbi:MAG TPA: vWA domain-containing protein, partial [Thermoanaerobaculia bacterium]|nr:vWA domain-containing protein [Thermoanaerobaculia bacterium]
MRVRSRWFILSGALGGLMGFLLMEMVSVPGPGAGTFTGDVFRMSIYFAGFGLAVGIALGMTEGVVLRRPGRALYGFIMGLILGAAGGFAGGALGQTIYSLVPRTHTLHSTSDLAIALDSSSSMRMLFFWGNDPWGQRQSAAKNLIDRLSPTDRVAIVDFDYESRVVHPLSFLGSETAREAAKAAVDRVDNAGGTNLSAGLDAAVGELAGNRASGRPQFIIFLTDGEGDYSPDSAARARQAGIKIYTVGLGEDIQADLLRSVAVETGGEYYPVADASELTALFERIVREHGGQMVEAEAADSDTNPLLLLGLRTLSWALMGLLIGLGQGVRENTREDLWACAFGGLLGGALGGALFDPVVNLFSAGNGLAGRALADLVVGACIGGSMRLAQEKIVEASGKPGTVLIPVLPKKVSVTFRPSPEPPPRPVPVPVPPPQSWASPSPTPVPEPVRPQPRRES